MLLIYFAVPRVISEFNVKRLQPYIGLQLMFFMLNYTVFALSQKFVAFKNTYILYSTILKMKSILDSEILKSPVGTSFSSFILRNPQNSALSWPSQRDSPGTLAVRLGAAPLVLQVAWEAELPSKGEGFGPLDNPKSAWSSHAKAAASGKDTRVLNLQNKECRTRDSFYPPRLDTKVHIFARYSFSWCEGLRTLESCNLPLRLHSL